jgi:hypothetical protein
MLPRVLLHVVEAPHPVQLAGDLLAYARWQRSPKQMEYDVVSLAHVAHRHPTQRTLVSRLASTLGVERRRIEHGGGLAA